MMDVKDKKRTSQKLVCCCWYDLYAIWLFQNNKTTTKALFEQKNCDFANIATLVEMTVLSAFKCILQHDNSDFS